MNWTNDLPTKAGYYLRNNYPASHIVKQHVGEWRGKMYVSDNDSGAMVFLDKWKGAKHMWWYGPIPDPPRRDPKAEPYG